MEGTPQLYKPNLAFLAGFANSLRLSAKHIQNAISAALLAKNEMLRMIATRTKDADPLVLGAAKEVAKLFLEMSESLHGKGVRQILEVQSEEDLENLSTEELKAFIAQNS